MPTENTNFHKQVTIRELNTGINTMNNGKTTESDDICCVEQIKSFGPGARDWILWNFLSDVANPFKSQKCGECQK